MKKLAMVGVRRKGEKSKVSSAVRFPLSELDFIQRHTDLYHGLKAAGLPDPPPGQVLKFRVKYL